MVSSLVIDASQKAQEAFEAASVARTVYVTAATEDLNLMYSADAQPAQPASPASSPASSASPPAAASTDPTNKTITAAPTTDTDATSTATATTTIANVSSPKLVARVVRTRTSSPPQSYSQISNTQYDNVMPSPLVRLQLFRQNLQSMIHHSSSAGSSSAVAVASDAESQFVAPHSSSMFNAMHQAENEESFSRLQILNDRVSSIKNELSRIVSGHAFASPSSPSSPSSSPSSPSPPRVHLHRHGKIDLPMSQGSQNQKQDAMTLDEIKVRYY